MSYILDALQKSAAPAEPDPLLGPAPPVAAAPTQLALHWKIAIGAVLLANVALVYRLMGGAPEVVTPAPAPIQAQPSEPSNAVAGTGPAATQPRPKIPLPGIAAPRNLPPATTNSAQSPTNTAPRTFKPRGAPITIAEGFGAAGTAPETAPSTTPAQRPPEARSPTQPTVKPAQSPARSKRVSRLSQLSDGARTALYVLNFSFHIYGSEHDLRAVVVNGERLQEGSSVTAGNGQQFVMEEITDSGVIVRFEHDGAEQRVEIPVMEDWKEA